MRNISIIFILLFFITSCDTFDDYDKIKSKPTLKIFSLENNINADTNIDDIYFYQYNNKGFLKNVYYDYNLDEKIDLEYRYYYNNNALLSKLEILKDNNIVTYSYSYYPNYFLKEYYVDLNSDRKFDYSYSYDYNEDNILTSLKVRSLTDINSSLDYNIIASNNILNPTNFLASITNPIQIGVYTTKDVEYKYSYNDKKLTKIEIDYNIDNSIDSIYRYYYNNNNLLNKVTLDYDNNGQIDYIYQYNYNNNKLASITIDYNNDNIFDMAYYYVYNENILKSYFIDYELDGIIDVAYNFSYLEDKYLQEVKIDYKNDGIIDNILKYIWLEFGDGRFL